LKTREEEEVIKITLTMGNCRKRNITNPITMKKSNIKL